MQTQRPVIRSRIRYELRSRACEEYAAEILAIVIQRQSCIPWPGRLRQLAADKPGCIHHVKIVIHLSNEPFDRRQITPKRAPNKFRFRKTISERSEEHTSELQSPCNLVCRLLLEKKKHTSV